MKERRMLKKLIFILLILSGLGLNAQELMLPELPAGGFTLP
jgi:hypothetical protein